MSVILSSWKIARIERFAAKNNRFIAWKCFQPGQEEQNCLILKLKEGRGSFILVASVVDLLFCCDYARPKLAMSRLCGTHVATLCDSWVNCVRLMIRAFSIPLTLYDWWFDPARTMIQPCSAHDSTLFDSWSNPVRLPIVFDSWFDPVWIYRACTTQDSNRFDSWFDPVWLMMRPCLPKFFN